MCTRMHAPPHPPPGPRVGSSDADATPATPATLPPLSLETATAFP